MPSLHPSRYGKDIEKTRLLAEALEVRSPKNEELVRISSSRVLIAEPDFGENSHFMRNAAKAKRQIMLHISFLLAPAFGVLMLGFILS